MANVNNSDRGPPEQVMVYYACGHEAGRFRASARRMAEPCPDCVCGLNSDDAIEPVQTPAAVA